MCLHPYAAWRTHSTAARLFILFAYAAASYAVMLGVLLISLSQPAAARTVSATRIDARFREWCKELVKLMAAAAPDVLTSNSW